MRLIDDFFIIRKTPAYKPGVSNSPLPKINQLQRNYFKFN
jgi:hypothetical protein